MTGDRVLAVGGSETHDLAKKKLLAILEKLLGCDVDLGFLLPLGEESLEQLIVALRMRLEE